MTGATHLLAGAAVYSLARTNLTRIRNIAPLGLALAFCSHFLLDAVPHYELSMPWQYALAAIAGLYILLIARRTGSTYLFLAGIVSALPDVICISGISPAFVQLHNFFHFKATFTVPLQASYLEAVFDIFLGFFLAGNELGAVLKKPWPSSQKRRNDLSVHSGAHGRVSCRDDVPGSRGVPDSILPLADRTSKPAQDER